jgi:hypothetical protein
MQHQQMHYSIIYARIFYIAPACFGAIISPTSGSWYQNLFKTYSNKNGYKKHVVVSLVKHFIGTG